MTSEPSALKGKTQNLVKDVPLDSTEAKLLATSEICSKKLENTGELESHIEKQKPYVCTVCDRRYSKQKSLERHVLVIHRKNQWFTKKEIKSKFSCEKCKVSFILESDLKAHIVTHSSNKKPFTCNICNYKSKDIPTLKTHLTVHTDEKLTSCINCGKRYRFKSQLLLHLMTHTNVKPFSCSECDQKFRQKILRDKHILKHKLVDKVPYDKKDDGADACNKNDFDEDASDKKDDVDDQSSKIECNKKPQGTGRSLRTFKPFSTNCENPNLAQTVIKSNQGECIDKEVFSCSICKYNFANIAKLKEHLVVHANVTLKTCTQCNKVFKWGKSLFNHLMKHTNVKSDKQSLNKKVTSNAIFLTKKKYHACPECDYKVTKKSLLEKHMLKHTPTFECTLCDHKSENEQDLNVHFSSHTGEMPVSCSLCNYKAAYQRNLDQHYKSTHLDEPSSISAPLKGLKISSSPNLT